MIDLLHRTFEPLHENGELILYRAVHASPADGVVPSMLVVGPAGEYVSPATLARLEHEYALAAELDPRWAARPLELERYRGRPVLVLEDPGGEPLDRLVGKPMEVGAFLRLAISVARAVGSLHAAGLIHKDIKPANDPGQLGDRRRLAHRLRHRLATSARAAVARAARDHRRHARLHGARADRTHEPVDRFAQRPLRARRHPVRDADRRSAVHRCRSDGVGALPYRAAGRCRPPSG